MNTLKLEEHIYLTENILKILKQNRIFTIIEFLQEDIEKLSILTKLTLPQILEIRHEIFNKYSAPLLSGSMLFIKSLTSKTYLATGINSLDLSLDKGIPVGLITEICGLAGCGKSQLCMQLAINCVKDSNDVVLYIDTKGDFSAVRIQKILETYSYSHKDMAKIMLKIRVVHIWNMEDLVKLLENMKNGITNIENLSLIIVDSLPCLMFQHFGDNNKIGLTFLNRVINHSRYLCKELQICFIYVNIQTRWIDQDCSDPEALEPLSSVDKDIIYTEKKNRCLGKYWQSIPALVLMMENSDSEHKNIKVTVIKHINPYMVQSCILKIDEHGVC